MRFGLKGAERKRTRVGVTRLFLQDIRVDAAPVYAGAGAGFQTAHLETQPPERIAQSSRRLVAAAAALHAGHAEMQQTPQEGARAYNHRARCEFHAQRSPYAADLSMMHQNVHDLGLLQRQVRLVLADPLHVVLVRCAVSLGARGMHRRAFRAVQHPKLNARAVNAAAHFAAQRVNLAHQLAFRHASDGGVTRHLADGVQLHAGHQDAPSHAGARQRGLDARMARSDHDYVKITVCHTRRLMLLNILVNPRTSEQ